MGRTAQKPEGVFERLFFPKWHEARDRRRKAVMVLTVLVVAAVLGSLMARQFGWDWRQLPASFQKSHF